jgi:hypothetical protein
MKKIAWMLLIVIVMAGNSIGCTQAAKSSTPPDTSSPVTPKPSSTSAGTVFATTLAKPAGGKAQEFTLPLKPPTGAYNMVIYLANGETLDLDWKYVASNSQQTPIRFMFSTPEGREMDAKLQPVNSAGHPFYDASLPGQKLEDAVGGHVEIKVGTDKYCNEGYYNLIYNVNATQTGNIYLRYSVVSSAK